MELFLCLHLVSAESERKVILFVAGRKIRSRSRIHRRERSLHRRNPRSLRVRVDTFYPPGTDTVEPTSLPFARINIERYIQLFTHLDIELLYLVCPKHIKAHSARILVVCFDDILLYFPFVTVP